MKAAALATIVVCCVALGACSGGKATPQAQTTEHRTLVVNDSPTDICVAVAETAAEQVIGLSLNPSLPPKQGMAFPFDNANDQTFNMRDTRIPLAIVWVDPDNKVLGSTQLTPMDLTPQQPPAPIILAVELAPQDWAPLAATARTITLGSSCPGTVKAGRSDSTPIEF